MYWMLRPRAGDGIVPYPPRLFCEIPVDLPQLTYGGFQSICHAVPAALWGVLPLDHSPGSPIVGAPGFLTSRDAARPAWVEIQLFGLPRGIAVAIRDTAGNVAGEVRTDASLIPGGADSKHPLRILTLRPKPKRDDVLGIRIEQEYSTCRPPPQSVCDLARTAPARAP